MSEVEIDHGAAMALPAGKTCADCKFCRRCVLFGFTDAGGAATSCDFAPSRFRQARACRICGCTEERACVTGDTPCHWVETDLCSACVGKDAEAAAAEVAA